MDETIEVRPKVSLTVEQEVKKGRVLVITSGKGGVGKTTTTANIGCSLAKLGHRVVLMDMDVGLRNLDVSLGVENRVIYNIMDVIDGKCRLEQALVKEKHFEDELYLMPASQTHMKEDVTVDKVVEIVEKLRESFEFVILDCPAGIEHGFRASIAPADEAIVVVTPDITSVRDADRVVGLLQNQGIHKINLVINRYDQQLIDKKKQLQQSAIEDVLGIEPIGIIPEDKEVVDSTNMGEALVLTHDTAAAKCFIDVARRITGESVTLTTHLSTRGLFALFARR